MATGTQPTATSSGDVLTLTAEIVASYLGSKAHVKADEIPAIIKSVRSALGEGGAPAAPDAGAPPQKAPKMHASAVKKSITPDALISFVDNKPYKTLKRHLARHGHDLRSYREAYGLPNDYPSVAPNYSAARSEMARRIGLGARGKGAQNAPDAQPPGKAPSARSRKKADTPAAE